LRTAATRTFVSQHLYWCDALFVLVSFFPGLGLVNGLRLSFAAAATALALLTGVCHDIPS